MKKENYYIMVKYTPNKENEKKKKFLVKIS